MENKNADKKVDTTDLPKQWERTTTQQPEEFIDKRNNEKDSGDVPGRDDTVKRNKGEQETG